MLGVFLMAKNGYAVKFITSRYANAPHFLHIL